MSVPLDNLYHWVNSLLPAPVIMYVFHTPGSKKISDCDWLFDYDRNTVWQFPGVIAHDQEPLDWDYYNPSDQYLISDHIVKHNVDYSESEKIYFAHCVNFNLKSLVFAKSGTLYDQIILIHSEKNSIDLEKYQQNGFICVHYWAHAVIARDWYRFAQIDLRLNTVKQKQNKFLIYCRDWSHRREYRLKFLELLIQNNLNQHSLVTVMHTNSEHEHFSDYEFANPEFELDNPELLSQIPANAKSSTVSATYDPDDFVNSEISVVLETVFDDSRIHLTEKTLRPIACGHPFLLAAGPGTLEYLRSYGFKTFAPWIDESYDLEKNSLRRLEKIIQSMKQIQNLSESEQKDFCQAMQDITSHNKKHFFSNEFFDQVTAELKNNLDLAYSQVKQTRGKYYLELTNLLKLQKIGFSKQKRLPRALLLRQLRQSCQSALSNPPEDQTA